MRKPIIEVNGLGKCYRLGQIGMTSLRESINRSWRKFTGRTLPDDENKSAQEFWAVRDISFKVERGEVIGIIGRNGAGKSTLLKLLSRITDPTVGEACLRGRVASLLEVGTGFHPELTAKENIYLNGAILGMTRAEVTRKLDEIVDFAGVEKFLDTPVKRFSSGMYVRLAFAVAAHLEPEILIVDEVLAVGDADFQKKALGKMSEVSTQIGRTVLFVSHQMSAISKICKRTLLFSEGRIKADGQTEEVINLYLGNEEEKGNSIFYAQIPDVTKKPMVIKTCAVLDNSGNPANIIRSSEQIKLLTKIRCSNFIPGSCMAYCLIDRHLRRVFLKFIKIESPDTNEFETEFTIRPNLLVPGSYTWSVAIIIPNLRLIDGHENICRFAIRDDGTDLINPESEDYGCVILSQNDYTHSQINC